MLIIVGISSIVKRLILHPGAARFRMQYCLEHHDVEIVLNCHPSGQKAGCLKRWVDVAGKPTLKTSCSL